VVVVEVHTGLFGGDNPVNNVDPSGEDFESIGFAMAAFSISASLDALPGISVGKALTPLNRVCVYVRADDDHAWICVENQITGEKHTYGRWKIGYPRNAPAKARSSGVNTDMELKRSYAASRGIKVASFTPTINAGYDVYNNNCATYAQSEWRRASAENLQKSSLFGSLTYDLPSILKDSILNKNGGKKEVILDGK
jgi:hypothetical protein